MKSTEHDKSVAIAEREMSKQPVEPPCTTAKDNNTVNPGMRSPGGVGTVMAPTQR